MTTDLDNGETDVSSNDDLRSSIEAAFDTPETPAEPETESEKAERLRDERGRFAKSDDTEAPKQSAPEAKATGPDTSTRKPPASWSKEWVPHWEKLDPAIQDIVLKREADVDRGFQERASKYKPWEQVEQVLSADIAKMQMQGVSAPQLVERLVNAHRLLENPQTRDQAWQFLIQQYGAPQFLSPPQQFQQQYQQQVPTNNPVYDQRLAQLEGYLRQQQESALMSQIETFAKGHSHFEKAAEDIEKLLRQGAATTLEEAYDLAIWKNPDIRKQVLEDQAKEQVAKTVQDTSRAKRASSSVTGAPTGGPGNGPKGSLREELEAAFERF